MTSATARLDALWADIEASAYASTELPDLGFPTGRDLLPGLRHVLSRRALRRTIDQTGDVIEDRPKVIHHRGAVVRVSLEVADSSPYTGVLAPGVTPGLLRFSLASPPNRQRSFIPGIGLKLAVDDHDSLDLVAVNHTNGQGRNPDVFANELTHDLTGKHEESRPPQRAMATLFRRVTDNPRRLTIDHLTAVDATGAVVDEPMTPPRLDLRPHDEVSRLFWGTAGEDFRRVLQRLVPGTSVYEVASADPRVGVFAVLRTTSAVVCSEVGDRLFFRHTVDPDDLVG